MRPLCLCKRCARPPRFPLIHLTDPAPPAADDTIATLSAHMEAGDLIIDGGNEVRARPPRALCVRAPRAPGPRARTRVRPPQWYPNTVRRGRELAPKNLLFMGMGVSGGEEGARHGPSLMPGGPRAAYDIVLPVLTKIAAQTATGPCVTYIGELGSGNYVKMVRRASARARVRRAVGRRSVARRAPADT